MPIIRDILRERGILLWAEALGVTATDRRDWPKAGGPLPRQRNCLHAFSGGDFHWVQLS